VESLQKIDLVHRPGQMWSYCNSGSVLVEEMVANRCAVGHLPGPGDVPVVPPVVVMEAASVPSGSRTVSTAAELARFVRMHLAGGTAHDGARLLSADSTRAMTQVQAARPPGVDAPLTQGLGWLMADWEGVRVIGHGGGTIGQVSFLEAIPGRDLIIVLLTNAESGGALWRYLGSWLYETLAGLRMPEVPKAAEPPPDLPLENYAGTYERLGVRYDVVVEDAQLVAHVEVSGPLAELRSEPLPPMRLRPVNRESFVTAADEGGTLVSFLEFRHGRPGCLVAGRAARRAGDESA
jgi:CubicO group peptidase (beta-lactamase class C family)